MESDDWATPRATHPQPRTTRMIFHNGCLQSFVPVAAVGPVQENTAGSAHSNHHFFSAINQEKIDSDTLFPSVAPEDNLYQNQLIHEDMHARPESSIPQQTYHSSIQLTESRKHYGREDVRPLGRECHTTLSDSSLRRNNMGKCQSSVTVMSMNERGKTPLKESTHVNIQTAGGGHNLEQLHETSQKTVPLLDLQRDLEILKLKQQVHEIGEKLNYGLHVQSNDTTGSQNTEKYMKLQERNESLEEKLGATEYELQQLQTSVEDLRSSHWAEIESLQSQKAKLQQKAEQWEEQYASLNNEHKKTVKLLMGVNNYLADLPSVDEVKELKQKLETKEVDYNILHEKLSENMEEVKQLRTTVRAKESSLREMEQKASELLLQLDAAKMELREMDQRRKEAREKGEVEVEELIWENRQMKNNIAKLKKILEYRQSKLRSQDQSHAEELEEVQNKLTEEQKKVMDCQMELHSKKQMTVTLKEQLKSMEEKCSSFERKIKSLQQTVDNMQITDKKYQECGHYLRKLMKELSLSVHEFWSLTDTSRQLMEGRNPNISMILGVTDIVAPPEDKNWNLEDWGEFLQTQLSEVRSLRSELDKIREIVSERFAESVASNMTSCITQ